MHNPQYWDNLLQNERLDLIAYLFEKYVKIMDLSLISMKNTKTGELRHPLLRFFTDFDSETFKKYESHIESMTTVLNENAMIVHRAIMESEGYETFVSFFKEKRKALKNVNRFQKQYNKYFATDIERAFNAKIMEELYAFGIDIKETSQRVCLVGTGTQGKSTMMKQLETIYTDKTPWYRDDSSGFYKSCGLHNVTSGLSNLLRKSTEYYEQNPLKYKDLAPPTPEELKMDVTKDIEAKYGTLSLATAPMSLTLQEAIEVVAEDAGEYRDTYDTLSDEEKIELEIAIKAVWQQPFVQAMYKQRYCKFYFMENIEYFINKLDEFLTNDYILNQEDISKIGAPGLRTCGAWTRDLNIDSIGSIRKNDFEDFGIELVDMGGNRSERIKWKFIISKFSTLIYIVGLNCYAHTLYQDHDANGGWECLKLLNQLLCDQRYFKGYSPIFLIFSKEDLLRQCIKDGIKVSQVFNIDPSSIDLANIPGANDIDCKFIGNEYDPILAKNNNNDEERKLFIDQCCKEAKEFIIERFCKIAQHYGWVLNKDLFVFTVDLTDTRDVQRAFEDIMYHVANRMYMNDMETFFDCTCVKVYLSFYCCGLYMFRLTIDGTPVIKRKQLGLTY